MEVSNTDRVIVLVDMDCFYVQVEQKLCPEYHNKPCAVVQYKTWKGGGIIAVNYEARAKGVSRHLRGDEAQKVCPDIHLFRVPEIRGKADLTRYREAGASVLDVLCEYSDCVERASIDEAYLDMTSVINTKLQNAPRVTSEQLKNTFVVGWEDEDPESRKEELEKWLQMIYEEDHLYSDRMLALAATIVEEMRTAVYEKTGYRCSAGIAHNKMLAKLSCGIHKPNKQTVLPQSSIQLLFKTIPIKKVRNLGGKLGEAIVKKYNVEKIGDLIDIPKFQFVNDFGEKTGNWLYNLVRGMDSEPVTSRQLPKSIGCGKNFPGKTSLSTKNDVIHWLKQLATELEERLVKDQNDNRRFARLLTISLRINENGIFSMISRSCPINVYNAEKFAHDALLAVSKLNSSSSDTVWKPSIWTLSMAASKFEDKLDNSHCNIESYFSNKSSVSKEIVNDTESTSSKSISSISAESKDDKASESINNSNLKSAKIHNPNKSIVSFFTKKQMNKTESFLNVEAVTVSEDKKEQNKEQDYFISVDNNTNSNEFIDTKMEKGSSIDGSPKDKSSNKLGETLGFFAKKLKERSEFNFDIQQETSCDSVNYKPISETVKLQNIELEASSSVSTNELSLCNISGINDSDLDPELTKLCEQCKKHVPIWEETEHSDYHLALSLSKEFSGKPSTNNSSFVSKSSIPGKSFATKSKRGSKRGSATKSISQAKKSHIQTKTLDAFFK